MKRKAFMFWVSMSIAAGLFAVDNTRGAVAFVVLAFLVLLLG